MALNVRDILQLDIMSAADPEVVAGADSLDRRVRWVHISELPDIAHLLQGGELLLTTGMGLGESAELQQRFVRELADVGVAGVVIELGRTFTSLPEPMVGEAERLRIPLIALRREVRFVEITEFVHSTIINQHLQLLEKAEKIRRDFTELAQRGAAAERIVHRLAEIVRNPVILEDRAHQIMEYAPHVDEVDALLEEWEHHSRRGHDRPAGSAVIVHDGEQRCAWMPLIVRREEWGRLHVLETAAPLDEMDLHAVDLAACIIGFTLLADKDAAQLAGHASGALISDILYDRFSSAEEVVGRSKALGCDLEGRDVLAVVAETGDLGRRLAGRSVVGEDQRRFHGSLLEEIRRGFAATRCSVIATLERDRMLAVIGLPPGTDASSVLDDAWAEIGPRVARKLDALSLVIGASPPGSVESLSRAFDEAHEALRYGMRVGRESGIYRLDVSDLHYLLLRLHDSAGLAQFVESELAPILEHDARRGAPLLPTLRAYLDCGGSKSAAARALHIERRSLYHRLRRITGLFNRDLDDANVRAGLIVALRGLDILQEGRRQTN